MSKLVKLQIYPEELLYLVTLQLKLVYGGGSCLLCLALKLRLLVYFKYVRSSKK